MSFASGAPDCMNMRFKDVSQKGVSLWRSRRSRGPSGCLGWAFPYREASAIYIDACISARQRLMYPSYLLRGRSSPRVGMVLWDSLLKKQTPPTLGFSSCD